METNVKKIRRGILKTFGYLVGALACITCAYWAIFEWHPQEIEVAARTFRLMTIFITIILGVCCLVASVFWCSYVRQNGKKN